MCNTFLFSRSINHKCEALGGKAREEKDHVHSNQSTADGRVKGKYILISMLLNPFRAPEKVDRVEQKDTVGNPAEVTTQ